MRYIYTFLLYLATPFFLLRLLWRSRTNSEYRYRWRERFGYIPKIKQTKSIWIHAVSLGETVAATPLIKALVNDYPQHTIIVTTTTPTGSAQVKKQFGEAVYHVYAPYDLPHIIKRFLKRAQVYQAIIMETELWPNQLFQLRRKKIPVLIANARLSERSFRRYQKLVGFFRPLLQTIQMIGAQSKADADRFQALGVKSERVMITGNIKFDLEIPANLIAEAEQLRQHWQTRPTFIAASTHEGEENIILHAFSEIRKSFSTALLILVPRHPERFTKVHDLCRETGYSIASRAKKEIPSAATQIYLGDTMGDLLLLYAASDVAFVGGSFISIGGHNLIEPAALKLPILSGPRLENFVNVRDLLLASQALTIVKDAHELARSVMQLFSDQQSRLVLGRSAFDVSQQNRGAVAKHLAWIAQN